MTVRHRFSFRVFTISLALILTAAAFAKDSGAQVRVKGLGWLQDRKMRQTLNLLLGSQRGLVLDSNALDDAALILFSSLGEKGYLKPKVVLETKERDGRTGAYPLDPTFEQFLPRSIAAVEATFNVKLGQRFFLDKVEFDGLMVMSAREARAFFRAEGTWFSPAAERTYSPDRLKRSLVNLTEELRRRGYAEASVETGDVHIDPASGRVSVKIAVVEGPKWVVSHLRYEVAPGAGPPSGLEKGRIGRPWSSLWRQDADTAVRRWYYPLGYPDSKIDIAPIAAPSEGNRRDVTAVIKIDPGPAVKLGRVRFVGNKKTHLSILKPLVRSKQGEPLNPLALDDAQFRLSHLGIFRGIDLSYDPPGGTVRDAVFSLKEANEKEVDLLYGYGSFDQLRGGVELHQTNLFGLAHSSTLQLVQSMKSSKGEYDYSVPELFGTSVDGNARLFGMQRHERSFLAEEYGATVSLSWPIRTLGIGVTTGYTFERLKNLQNTLATFRTDQGQANAASLNLGLTLDRLDNSLDPHKGHKVFFHLVEASRKLGGQVDFQQWELSASYHTPWGASRWIHLGFTHDVVTTFGASSDVLLPVNVRFYPGGDQSIRGYGLGEAAPRTASGQFLGAKSVVLLNAELEQALTSKFSLVAFSDSLGITDRLAHYPFQQKLYTAGLGVRFRTLIGPIRLEYGRNLNPRPFDPSGTLLLSVGFPF